MHHETSSAPRTYEQQLDAAYTLMKKHGIHGVKTGYVGKIIPKGEYHHGQWMVNHFRKVLETAAKYQVAINAHEPIKATGIRRTYPNAITREGLRGVAIYSPLQMACDLIEHYENQPAFQFIRDVGVDWEDSKVLNGEVGDFVTIARQEKGTGDWFLGSITDEEQHSITINFDFLEAGTDYQAIIYSDGADAHWDQNPLSIDISNATINSTTVKTFNLAPGGGLAISLKR